MWNIRASLRAAQTLGDFDFTGAAPFGFQGCGCCFATSRLTKP
jgi:hypothetical protein